MKERTRSLIASLEHDPANTEVVAHLEELVSGEGIEDHLAEVRTELEEGRARLIKAGRFHAADSILNIEAVLVQNPAEEGALLVAHARLLDEDLFDQARALGKLTRARELLPDDEQVAEKIMLMQAERERYREIVATFREQAESATDATLKAHLLCSAAERLFKNEKDNPEILPLLRAALDEDPSHQKAARLMEFILEQAQDWKALAEFYLQMASRRKAKHERVQMFLAAGYTYGYRLESMDDAAMCYAEVLDYEPGQSTALKFLVKYYEEKEDWQHLVAVYEDTLHGRLSPEDEIATCMQVGMVYWKFMNDIRAAEKYFRRLSKIDACHPGMIEFYRKYAEACDEGATLLKVLENAVRASNDAAFKDTLTREIAQLSGVEGGNVEKAIDAWKKVLRQDKDNREALAQLRKLYRQSGKWNNLIDLLRQEAESLDDKDVEGRVARYEEMVEIYQNELNLEMMVIKVYNTILEIDPANLHAMDALMAVYETGGRWNDLIKVLTRRTETARRDDEKVRLLHRVATLWVEQFKNFNKAVEPLEAILEIDPCNREAIAALKGIYEKRRAWKPLMALLQKELDLQENQDARNAIRVEMANLAADKLNDQEAAIGLWWQISEEDPANGEALATIEKLTERAKDWDGLVKVLKIRIDRATEREDRVNLHTKLGTIYKDRLSQPALAAEVWKALLAVDPGNAKAMRSLKEAYQDAEGLDLLESLYTEAGDYESLVEVLGIAADRAKNAETKILLSFRCAQIYNENIGQPDRAERHYERVLTVDEKNQEAAAALAPIYRRFEKWSRLLGVMEISLEGMTDVSERVLLMDEMRQLAAEQLNNRDLAFKWAARAFEEMPTDASIRATLEDSAEQARAWDRLVEVYRKNLDAFAGDARIELEKHIARLSLDRLGNVEDAIRQYVSVLKENPAEENALLALDAIYRSTGQWNELEGIFEARIAHAATDDASRQLMMEKARMYEEGLDDPAKAAAEYRRVLQLVDNDAEALDALERIFQVTGRFSDLVGVLGQQLEGMAPGSDPWKQKKFQMAVVVAGELKDAAKGIAIYQEVLDEIPADADAIERLDVFLRDAGHQFTVAKALEPHLVVKEDWRRLAWVLSIIIENTPVGAERIALNMRLADIYADRLGDTRLAFDTIGAAVAESPNEVALWDRIEQLGHDLQMPAELALRLTVAYDSRDMDDALKVDLAERLARLYGEELGQAAEAERFHRLILEQKPEAMGSFTALEQFYTANEQWAKLLALYTAAKDNELFGGDRLDLLLKICFVVHEVSHDVPASIAAYRDVMEVDPVNEAANRALVDLYEEAQQWEELSALLQVQLSRADAADRIALQFRIGELLELKLKDVENAIGCYEQVIGADPDHLKTQRALERLLDASPVRLAAARLLAVNYEHQGAAEPLTRVLMIMLEDRDLSASERVELLLKVADIRERRLSDATGAFEALALGIAEDCESEAVFEQLSRVAAEHGFAQRYCELLERTVEKCDDLSTKSRFMLAIARTYDEALRDEQKAQDAYNALLRHDPENPDIALPAISALDRIYSARESWENLLDVLRRRVSLLDDTLEQREVLQRMADVEETVLGRSDRAIRLYCEIRELDETYVPALSGLERLYGAAEQWKELIEVLQSRAVCESDNELRRDILLQIAGLFETKLGDDEEAISAYCQVNDEIGPNLRALEALEKLYLRAERWKDLLGVFEAQLSLVDEDRQVELHFRVGELLREQLDEPEEAVSHYADTLAKRSDHAGARSSLEKLLDTKARIAAIEILTPIAEAEGDYDRQLKFTLIRAKESDDALEKSDLFRRAAEIAESGLDDAVQAFSLYTDAVRSGTSSPELASMLDNIERLAGRVDGHRTLTSLYADIAPDILDGALQVRCYLMVADTACQVLKDTAMAREYYLKIMDTEADNDRAMNALEDIYRSAGEYLELFEIYRQKVHNTYDDAVKIQLLFKQANVCEEHLKDLSSATQSYESILEVDSANAEAIAALERLYPVEERWTDLVELLERRRAGEPRNRVELSHRLGMLVHSELGDEERALELFRDALAENIDYAPTIELLERLMTEDALRGRVAEILEPVYSHQGRWDQLARVLDARLEICEDVMDRKSLLRRIGMVYEEQLGDLEKAFDTFGRLFKEDAEDRESRELLTRLAGILDNWDQLAQVFAQVLEDTVGDTPETAELAFILGEIYEKRLGSPDRAKNSYRRVLAFAPDDPRAFDAVERMLLATASWPDLLALYRDAADAASDMAKQKEFLFKMADIQEERIDDRDAAVSIYKEVLDLDDADERATNALDRLYFQNGKFDDLAEHFRNQINLAGAPEQRNALRRELAKVQEENLQDPAAAVDTYEEALSEPGGDRGSLAQLERLILNDSLRERIATILEPIYRETDQWKKLVVILKAQVEYQNTPADKVEKLKEIAVLHETRGSNFVLAFRSLAKAFATDPTDRSSYDEMHRLAWSVENWEELAEAIAPTLEDVYDTEFKKELLGVLGHLYDQKLDLPRKAIEAFVRVLEIDDSDADALNALEGLYNLVGDWNGLVDILARKADISGDPEEQCQLLRARASIQEELMANADAAIASYVAALDRDSSSVPAMLSLERLYEAKEKWNELIEIRRQRFEVTGEAAERRTISASIAVIFEQKLNDSFEAINAWKKVLEEDDRDLEAVTALDRLYTREGNWVELLDNLQQQKQLIPDQAAWVELTMRIGDLQRTELSDPEGAVSSYRDVIAQQPTHAGAIARLEELAKDEAVRPAAIEVLEPLHRDAGRWDRLIDLLELKLEIENDPALRLQILLNMAELHETGRSDPATAFQTWVRALKQEPGRRETIAALERIAAAETLYRQLAEVYESVVDELYNPEAERAILQRLGEIREANLGDVKGAIAAYRKLYDNGDMSLTVLSSLDRLYERSGLWTELDEILDQEISAADRPEDANRLKMRQAKIREREFKDFAGAISVYRDIAESSPQNDDVISALEALLSRSDVVLDVAEILGAAYEARGEQHKIVRLIEVRLKVAQDDSDRLELYRTMAVHQEQILGDAASAFDAFANAFRLAPDDAELVAELERLAEVTGSWSALVDLAEKAVAGSSIKPEEKVAIGLKIAGWAFNQVGDPKKAERLYRSVLEQDPEHQDALAALVGLLTGLGRFEDLLPILQKQADVAYDFSQKKEILVRAAQIARIELSSPDRAIGYYRQLLENDESDLEVIDALIDLTQEKEDYGRLVELLLARAQFTNDMTEANRFRHRAATLFMGALSKPEKAIEVYREILEVNPADGEAVNMLESAFENAGKWTELQEIYQHKLDLATTDAIRVDILRNMAGLCEKRFEDFDGAVEKLQEILLVLPEDEMALDSLERIFIRQSRWQDLADLLEDQGNRAAAAGNGKKELEVLVKIGELSVDRLEDSARATEIYERVLERDPEHTRALSALAKLYEAGGDWDRVVEVLNRAAASGRGGQDEAEVHYRLALLHENRLGDENAALAALHRAVSVFPGHLDANRRLAALCRQREDWNGLLEALMREEAYLTDDREKIERLIEIAQLQVDRLSDPVGSVASLEKAYGLDKSNLRVLLLLSDALVDAGRQDDAIPVIRDLIDAETNGGKKRTKTAAVYHQKLARAFSAKGDLDAALQHLDDAYRMDISNTEVLVALGRLRYDRREFDEAAKLFRALLLQKFDQVGGLSKADIYWYVGDIQLQQGDPRKAKGMFQRGLDEDKNHEGCRAGLAKC